MRARNCQAGIVRNACLCWERAATFGTAPGRFQADEMRLPRQNFVRQVLFSPQVTEIPKKPAWLSGKTADSMPIVKRRASFLSTGSQQEGEGASGFVPFFPRGAERKEARTDGIEGRLRPTLAIFRPIVSRDVACSQSRTSGQQANRATISKLVQCTAEAPPTGGACTRRRGSRFRPASPAL